MPPRRTGNSNDERTINQQPAGDPTSLLTKALEIFNDDWPAPDSKTPLNLAGKIAAISGHIGRIPKNGYNSFNKYPYVLEADVVEAIRYFLSAARILIYQSVKDWRITENLGKSGDSRTDILYTFTIIDGHTGETLSFDQLGQGSDPRDKGSNKASTSAMKFAYLRLFNLSSGEDSEADEEGDQRAAMGSTRAPAVTVTPSTVEGAQRGGKQENASGAQIRGISQYSNQLGLGALGLAEVIKEVLGDDIELGDDESMHGPTLAKYLQGLKAEEIGKLIYHLQQQVKEAPIASGV